jgi:hypothetical protein
VSETSAGRSSFVARRSRATGWRETVALEVVLWIALVLTVMSQVVRPLADAGGPRWGVASWGETPTVTVTLDDAALATVTPSGLPAVGADAVLPGDVSMAPTGQAVVILENPTFRQLAAAYGEDVGYGLVVACVLVLAILAVRDLRRGELFTRRNLRRIYAAGVVVAGGGMLAQAVGLWGRTGLLADPAVAPHVVLDWTLSWAPLVAGLVVLGVAEAVRQGIAMRRDVEGLV